MSQSYESSEVLTISSNDPREEWIMDSRYTFHITPKKEWFIEYRELNEGKVLMGNNNSCKVIGVGSMRIKLHDGSVKTLTDVRHIPDLKKNLISLGTLDKSGCSYKAEGGVLNVIRGSMVLMKGLLVQGLYVLQGTMTHGDTKLHYWKGTQVDFCNYYT